MTIERSIRLNAFGLVSDMFPGDVAPATAEVTRAIATYSVKWAHVDGVKLSTRLGAAESRVVAAGPFASARMLAFFVGTLVIVLARFVPWSPGMPSQGLDPSWRLGVNELVADGKVFGRDVMFTYGPASSIFTAAYHPATYALGCVLCGVLGVAVWLSLWTVFGQARPWFVLVVSLVVAGAYERESILVVVPLVTCLAFFKLAVDNRGRALLAGALLVAVPAGILVTAKGTMLPLSALAVATCVVSCLRRRRGFAMSFAALVPVGVTALVWRGYGQPIGWILPFFEGVLELTSGYSEAMSSGGFRDHLGVLVVVGGIGLWVLVELVRSAVGPSVDRAGLALVATATLFTLVKLGVVRPSGHIESTLAGIMLLVVIVVSLAPKPRLRGPASAGLVLVASASALFGLGGAIVTLPLHQGQSCVDAARGLGRAFGLVPSLTDQYVDALSTIRSRSPLPLLPGTVDTYSYDQAELISTDNHWSPRPVFQSYSAFTSTLAQRNREHLTGSSAPNWVLFAPQAIDDRYPSVEDGPSWVELLSRYRPVEILGDKVLLQKRATAAGGALELGESQSASLGERVPLKTGEGRTFITFDIRMSVVGRAASVLYTSEPLRLTVWTADGSERTFRLPVEMARAGFLVSPVVGTASDFASLYAPSSAEEAQRDVIAFRIDSVRAFWQDSYRFAAAPISVSVP